VRKEALQGDAGTSTQGSGSSVGRDWLCALFPSFNQEGGLNLP